MKNKFIGIPDASFLDLYSISHLIFGLVVGIIFFLISSKSNWLIKKGSYFAIGFSILILWELFEFLLRYIKNYYPDLAKKLSLLPNS